MYSLHICASFNLSVSNLELSVQINLSSIAKYVLFNYPLETSIYKNKSPRSFRYKVLYLKL